MKNIIAIVFLALLVFAPSEARAQHVGLVPPPGTQYVAIVGAQERLYYSVTCDTWREIPGRPQWFGGSAAARAAGYRPSTAPGCSFFRAPRNEDRIHISSEDLARQGVPGARDSLGAPLDSLSSQGDREAELADGATRRVPLTGGNDYRIYYPVGTEVVEMESSDSGDLPTSSDVDAPISTTITPGSTSRESQMREMTTEERQVVDEQRKEEEARRQAEAERRAAAKKAQETPKKAPTPPPLPVHPVTLPDGPTPGKVIERLTLCTVHFVTGADRFRCDEGWDVYIASIRPRENHVQALKQREALKRLYPVGSRLALRVLEMQGNALLAEVAEKNVNPADYQFTPAPPAPAPAPNGPTCRTLPGTVLCKEKGN